MGWMSTRLHFFRASSNLVSSESSPTNELWDCYTMHTVSGENQEMNFQSILLIWPNTLMQVHPRSLEHVCAIRPLKLRSTEVLMKRINSLQCVLHTCSSLQWRWVLQQEALCFWFHLCSFPTCLTCYLQDFHPISSPRLESFSMQLNN